MLAVALIDGEVQPEQYAPERIAAVDVQGLLRRVSVTPVAAMSARFPGRMPADLGVELDDGRILHATYDDYHGFHTNPFDWKAARAKFDRLAGGFCTAGERDAIANVIATTERRPVSDLTKLLGSVRNGARADLPAKQRANQ
jgi:2-methylcitrate dehydratase